MTRGVMFSSDKGDLPFNLALKSNLAATAAPTTAADSSLGYEIGSVWIYSTAVYICTSAAVGAATWNLLEASGAAGVFTTLSVSTGMTLAGTLSVTPTSVVAAGATQGTATALTNRKNIAVATTVSTKGVKLPTASTGLEVEIGNGGSFAINVYPPSGGKIGAVATNGADTTKLAINKVNVYKAVNTTFWIVQRGA